MEYKFLKNQTISTIFNVIKYGIVPLFENGNVVIDFKNHKILADKLIDFFNDNKHIIDYSILKIANTDESVKHYYIKFLKPKQQFKLDKINHDSSISLLYNLLYGYKYFVESGETDVILPEPKDILDEVTYYNLHIIILLGLQYSNIRNNGGDCIATLTSIDKNKPLIDIPFNDEYIQNSINNYEHNLIEMNENKDLILSTKKKYIKSVIYPNK